MAIQPVELQDVVRVLGQALAERRASVARETLRRTHPDDAAAALDALKPQQLAGLVTLLGTSSSPSSSSTSPPRKPRACC